MAGARRVVRRAGSDRRDKRRVPPLGGRLRGLESWRFKTRLRSIESPDPSPASHRPTTERSTVWIGSGGSTDKSASWDQLPAHHQGGRSTPRHHEVGGGGPGVAPPAPPPPSSCRAPCPPRPPCFTPSLRSIESPGPSPTRAGSPQRTQPRTRSATGRASRSAPPSLCSPSCPPRLRGSNPKFEASSPQTRAITATSAPPATG